MNVVNLGDRYNRRLNLRLSDKQFDFLIDSSKEFGCTPSEYIRKLLDNIMGGSVCEYVKADFDNKL